MYTIASSDYISDLRDSSNFANISTETKDNALEDAFKGLDAAYGWYITDVFFKKTLVKDAIIDDNNAYPHLKIFENKNLTEKTKNPKKGSKSDIQKFDNTFLSQIQKETKVKDIDGYFQFFFPAFILLAGKLHSTSLLIMLNIKKLPLSFYFEFEKANNTVNTYPRLNNHDQGDQELILKNGLSSVDETYYEVKVFDMSKFSEISYSTFIKKFYVESKPQSEIQIGDEVDKLTFTKSNSSLTITKKSDVTGTVSIQNYRPDFENRKKIVYNNESTSDARILYYENCLNNDKIIPNDKKKTVNNSNSQENMNKIANYYDLAFNTKFCRTFLVSNSTPGYHVLAYQPSLIYRGITDESELTINFTELYKDIFKNKIIEIEVETLS